MSLTFKYSFCVTAVGFVDSWWLCVTLKCSLDQCDDFLWIVFCNFDITMIWFGCRVVVMLVDSGTFFLTTWFISFYDCGLRLIFFLLVYAWFEYYVYGSEIVNWTSQAVFWVTGESVDCLRWPSIWSLEFGVWQNLGLGVWVRVLFYFPSVSCFYGFPLLWLN